VIIVTVGVSIPHYTCHHIRLKYSCEVMEVDTQSAVPALLPPVIQAPSLLTESMGLGEITFVSLVDVKVDVAQQSATRMKR
jgi:hypothetical protein